MTANRLLFRVFLWRVVPLLLLAFAGSGAVAQTDPPARVASLSHIEGSVVLAPAGDNEWTDAVLNRPVTRGDRLWTDHGARAELHLGSAVLHIDGETFLDVTALNDDVLQASLNEGAVNARVRQLDPGENFEIDTPNLAFRASQPGDYRIDVDPARGTTRVTVRSGIALVYGARGEAQQLQPGQQIAFAGRDLERVAVQALPVEDGFDRWAADRNRLEDQSIAARYVPREVVGYQQLDPYGSWTQDPSYGAIWFPRVTVADWAPYRYGHWEWISPWGWTWIDDAPWGFAPFHYGRWALIGSRWAWVPGRIGPRPIYAPALVVFVGGGGTRGSWSLSIGSSPGIAWYPLAPGEAWRPAYRTSPVYVRNVNRNIVIRGNTADSVHIHQRRAEALTGLKVEDFSRGRPVHSHWTRVNPADIARAPVATPLTMPEPRRLRDGGRVAQPRTQPPAQVPAPPTAGQPQPRFVAPNLERREPGDRSRPVFRPREDARDQQQRRRDEQRPLMEAPRGQPERAPQVRQEERRQGEQRLREEQRREPVQQLQRQEQERAQREQRASQQELQQQRAMEQQQRRAAQQQELQQRRAEQQQRAAQQRQQPPQISAPPAAKPAPEQRGEMRGRAAEQPRGQERRSQAEDEGRGRGRGQGRGD